MNIRPRRAPRVVLGMDAAWTAGRPSGVAVAVQAGERWTLRAVAASYDHFLAIAAGKPSDGKPTGSIPDVPALLAAAHALTGAAVTLVAIDMPVSLAPITGRRESDDAIARAFGARHCATHSPGPARPGALGAALTADFTVAGYPVQASDARRGGLIEVYPHPALVVLAGAARRLPYKAGNSAKYWPGLPIAERRDLLAAQWRRIAALLATRIDGVADHLQPLIEPTTGIARKAYEDMLDAIVCTWVGITALDGQAVPYGDAVSAIWVPREGDGTPAPAAG